MAISTSSARSVLLNAGAAAPKQNAAPAPGQAEVPCTSWYLENVQANHYKFYWVLVSDTGHCIFAWGRIGTAGQAKVQKFNTFGDAEAAGIKQFYSKAARGYEEKERAIKFTVPLHMLQEAERSGKADALMSVRRRAIQDPKFKGEQATATRHLDTFIESAQKLMERAANSPVELLFDDWQALQDSWAELEDRFDTARTTLSLTGQMLQAKLAGG